jgi:hypothetical protein
VADTLPSAPRYSSLDKRFPESPDVPTLVQDSLASGHDFIYKHLGPRPYGRSAASNACALFECSSMSHALTNSEHAADEHKELASQLRALSGCGPI